MAIFKLSDSPVKFGTSGVRGLVVELTPAICYAYAVAFWRAAGLGGKVVIGHDLRPSSPDITRACCAAMADLGVEVDYVGALPTPAIAYYAASMRAPAIVVTGSHIPFDRNGIKFYRAEGEINKQDEQAILATEVEMPESIVGAELPTVNPAGEAAYIARYVNYFGAGSFAGMKVALYQHSSVARDLIQSLLEQLGAEVIALGRTETFVPIDTEAVRQEDIEQALSWAQQYDFDLIVSTDGDADRPLIGDEQGVWLRGDVVGALTARYLGADSVVAPVSCNTVLEKSDWFSHIARTRIGSPYVIAGMDSIAAQDPSAVVAGYEANGGFLLGSPAQGRDVSLAPLPTRDAVLPVLAMMALISVQKQPLSSVVAALPARYTHSDRIQAFATEKSRAMLASFAVGSLRADVLMSTDSGEVTAVDETDGYRVTFANEDIVHLRPSGNAPELRCYAEASSVERAKILCDRCLAAVQGLTI